MTTAVRAVVMVVGGNVVRGSGITGTWMINDECWWRKAPVVDAALSGCFIGWSSSSDVLSSQEGAKRSTHAAATIPYLDLRVNISCSQVVTTTTNLSNLAGSAK